MINLDEIRQLIHFQMLTVISDWLFENLCLVFLYICMFCSTTVSKLILWILKNFGGFDDLCEEID